MGTVTAPPTRSRFARRVAAGLFVVVGVLLAVGVIVVVSSWSDDPESSAQATGALVGPDYYASAVAVCALLSPDDLAMALGHDYSRGFEPDISYSAFAGIPGMTRCAYVEEEGSSAVAIGLVYAYAEQIFEQRRGYVGDMGEVTEVESVGDEAFYAEAASEMVVLADDKVIAIIIPVTSAPREEDRIELAKRLVDKVIARLQ